jgi:hypothetical protein
MNTFGPKVTSNDLAFPCLEVDCLEVGQIFNLRNEKKEYYVENSQFQRKNTFALVYVPLYKNNAANYNCKLHLHKEMQHKTFNLITS